MSAGRHYPATVFRPLLAVLAAAMLVTSCAPVNRQGPASGAASGAATAPPPPTVPVTAVPPSVEAGVPTATVGVQVPASISVERISGVISDLGVYDITYPQVSGTPGDDAVNARLRSIAENDAAWFVGDLSELAALEEEYTDEWWEGVPSELGLAGTVVHTDDRLVTVRFERYWYPSGAAHGQHSTQVMTFDAVTGEEVRLGDLFQPGSQWLAVLAPAVVEAFVSAYGDMVRITALELRAVRIGGDRSVGVVADGMEISFDAYSVGPGVLGSPWVLVPWAAVLDVVDLDGPAGHLVH